jgi:hypothetical protein
MEPVECADMHNHPLEDTQGIDQHASVYLLCLRCRPSQRDALEAGCEMIGARHCPSTLCPSIRFESYSNR